MNRLAVALLCCASTAWAHDFWVQPSKYRPEAGTDLQVRLFFGDHFRGKAYARNPGHVDRFVLVGPDETRKIAGDRGDEPAGKVKVENAGTYVVGYRSRRSRTEFEAKKFEDYLRHEGLDHVVKERARRGESESPGRELFSRCAKSIVWVGAGSRDGFDRELGFPLELIPVTNPYAAPKTGDVTVRVLFRGKPLANALVTAHHEPGSHDVVDGRTDDKGRVTLRLPHQGEWMLNTVHMFRTPEEKAKALKADWESLWASMTFELPPVPASD